jgi:hypothetical protein
VHYFLASEGARSEILDELLHDLRQLRFGVASGALTPKVLAGRKKDSPEVSFLKGRIAGIARLQMMSGQSRDYAAAWVARKIPTGLESQLSSKAIKASTVKEWIEQYDCGVANILKVFSSEEKVKDFESCFRAPGTGKDDDDSSDRFVRQLTFLRELVPENKRRNSFRGIQGFIFQISAYFADGCPPNLDHLLTDLEELPSGPSVETDL